MTQDFTIEPTTLHDEKNMNEEVLLTICGGIMFLSICDVEMQ